jgi:tetratricopeptide (TPR) repeat protein
MSDRYGMVRRVAIACTGIAAAALLLRPQISASLVTRGDDLVYQGNVGRSLVMYRRAIAIDPQNDVAVDRVAFEAVLSHRPDDRRFALAVTSRYLQEHPDRRALLMDRGLLYQQAAAYLPAHADFERAAALSGDAQAYSLAGFDALHAGRVAAAAADFRRALAIDPYFVPARRGMERTSRWKHW